MTYEDIYSKFLGKITDSKLMSLEKKQAYIIMKDYLEDALSLPYVQTLFVTVECDDDTEEITFNLNNSINNYDEKFVKDVLAQAMVIAWMNQKIDTDVNLAKAIGGKEEKKLIDNYSTNIERVEKLEVKLQKTIRNHGYYFGNVGNS